MISITKEIIRINQKRAATRYYKFVHPDSHNKLRNGGDISS